MSSRTLSKDHSSGINAVSALEGTKHRTDYERSSIELRWMVIEGWWTGK
jgi:hypothetical protein